MDRIDPAEPMDSSEPLDPMLRADPTEAMLRQLATDHRELAERPRSRRTSEVMTTPLP